MHLSQALKILWNCGEGATGSGDPAILRNGGQAHPDHLVGTDTEAKGQSAPASETDSTVKKSQGRGA